MSSIGGPTGPIASENINNVTSYMCFLLFFIINVGFNMQAPESLEAAFELSYDCTIAN